MPVTTTDVTEYVGDDETQGNTGQDTIDVNAHGWYFNNISDCYPGGFELRRRDVALAF